ncbi:hypothetical protein MELA_00615 [Candidatus Methylomirabilis lanthanidiphila]|uniref:Uncharacterized protein n=1 Tax=Candidatus Methylomirabilis lanthanidiphila TaxID=2211376 RepID=A0A564ZG11_9BACT|nr:hypothetical protein MELA_00615 [Candidatus Methylomirabilis lanthanidiphila]
MERKQQFSFSKETGDLNCDFEGHRRRQVRLGLALSPAKRLR